jgi:hypothetical protein
MGTLGLLETAKTSLRLLGDFKRCNSDVFVVVQLKSRLAGLSFDISFVCMINHHAPTEQVHTALHLTSLKKMASSGNKHHHFGRWLNKKQDQLGTGGPISTHQVLTSTPIKQKLQPLTLRRSRRLRVLQARKPKARRFCCEDSRRPIQYIYCGFAHTHVEIITHSLHITSLRFTHPRLTGYEPGDALLFIPDQKPISNTSWFLKPKFKTYLSRSHSSTRKR